MAKIIYENNFEDLLLELSKKYLLVAPLEKADSQGKKIIFTPFKSGGKLALNYPTSILPPKKFLLPPTEILFSFTNEKTKEPKENPLLVFGLSYEDLEGIFLLSKLMSEPVIDEPFQERFEKTAIIAIDRFSPPKNIPFDLYFQKLNEDAYAVFTGSKLGQIISKSPLIKTRQMTIPKVSKKKDPLLSNPALPKIIKNSRNNPVWKELSSLCFGCGICSYVCPLCYCSETEDKLEVVQAGELTGARCRSWNSCILPKFADTSTHNFRSELPERIYNWYYHKFYRMPKEHGFIGCIDCNRCTIYCPAKINYRKVLERLVKDYHEKS